MKRLCVIYSMAAKYRAPIFQLMDKEMDIDWYYGEQIGDITEMDSSLLKNVTKLKRKNFFGCIYIQHGVSDLVKDNKYDKYIVLGDLFAISTWLLLLKKHFFYPHKKIYLWSHGWYGREGWFKRFLKRIFFGLADGTFLYGNYAKSVAASQGNDTNKLWVIHNSLDHENHVKLRSSMSKTTIYKTHFGNERPTIIFVGRLTPVKKLDLVIQAVNLLARQCEKYNLIFIGDGQERNKLENLAVELGVNVWFYGSCYDDKQIAQLIYDADLCVSPGNVGLTAIHTMSFGTPVLTHSNFSNQMPEFEAIIENRTGAFFKENSIESLATAISNWFASHTNRAGVRNACFKEIDNNWTPEFQLQQLRSVL